MSEMSEAERQNAAILKTVKQVVAMQDQIYALESALSHLITWSSRELGNTGVKQLLDIIDEGFAPDK